MNVFDDIVRTHEGPKRYAEACFDYYNRSARPEIEVIRGQIEEWFESYPVEHKKELRRRLRDDFESPFFELVLHELLRRRECEVVVHPDLGTGSRRKPEFLVCAARGEKFVLEATLCRDESTTERSTKKLESTLLDLLQDAELPNFMLDVEPIRIGQQPPSANKIRTLLETEAAKYDPDDVAAKNRQAVESGELGLEALPKVVFRSGDTTIWFRLVPVKKEKRGASGRRPIGSISQHAPKLLKTWEALRTKIEDKRPSPYGDFRLPYVVAVNAVGEFRPHDYDMEMALFGEECVQVARTESGRLIRRYGRKKNGVWGDSQNPRNGSPRCSSLAYLILGI